MHTADSGGGGSESFFCKTIHQPNVCPGDMSVHAADDVLVSLQGWEEPLGDVQGLPLLLAWGQRCQSQTLPQKEPVGITSSCRAFALRD